MFDLSGRTALVTGARTGIGRGIAAGLAQAGADLVLHGHHDDLDEVEEDVVRAGRHARRWVLDLSDPTQPKPLGYYNTWDPQADYTSSDFFEGSVGLDVDMTRHLVFVADSPRGLLILQDTTE